MAAPNPFEQIKTFFTRYSLQQKLALAGSGALVLVLLWVLVYFVNRVEYQTLYADLDPQEAQGIIQKLQELKVPYRSEEHTSELQSQSNLVCRLLLEKKKALIYTHHSQ